MFKRTDLTWMLIAAFALESLFVTYFLKAPSFDPLISVIYFLSGIAIAVMFLYFPSPGPGIFRKRLFPGTVIYFKALLMFVFGFLIYHYSKELMTDNPIDYRTADMLPLIKTMNQRFLSGHWKQVYDKVPEIWNGSSPVYLPAMWLPYSPATGLGIDLRWTTALCLFLAFAIPVFLLSFRDAFSFLILAISAMLLWWLLSEDESHGFISMSEEGVVVLFYVILVIALISENIYLIAPAACLCLFSRYALIGWIPAFFIFLLLSKKKRSAFVFSAISLFFLFFMFIIPFGWPAFLRLVQLPGYYIDFSQRVWRDSPQVFTDSIGLAKFFMPGKIHLLHILLVGSSFILPASFMMVCNYYKERKKLSNISLATLKISLVIFYNLIDVPYLYLFYTSSLVSLTAIVFLLNGDKKIKGLKTSMGS